MSNYTKDEVLAALEPLLDDVGWSELRYDLFSTWSERQEYTITLRNEEIELKGEASKGGSDQGSEAWLVIRVGDQLFRKEGYYASHYGYDWDGEFEEVEAQPQTITIYNRK